MAFFLFAPAVFDTALSKQGENVTYMQVFKIEFTLLPSKWTTLFEGKNEAGLHYRLIKQNLQLDSHGDLG